MDGPMVKVMHSDFWMTDFLKGLLQLQLIARQMVHTYDMLHLSHVIKMIFEKDKENSDCSFAALLYSTATCAPLIHFPRLRAVVKRIYKTVVGHVNRFFLQTFMYEKDAIPTDLIQRLQIYVLFDESEIDLAGARNIVIGLIFLLRSPRAEWILTINFDELHSVKAVFEHVITQRNRLILDGVELAPNKLISGITSFEEESLFFQ